MATRQQNDEDRKENLHELADQFGEGVGNAEALIEANARRRTADLATIGSLPLLQDKTNELDLDKVKLDEDDLYVLDGAWRGSGRTAGLIVTAEDTGGRLHKILVEHNIDEGRPEGPRKSSHAKNAEDEAGKDESKKSESTKS